jgi:hypothetical protein
MTWSDAAFVRKVEQGAARLPVLGRTPRVLVPGGYRSYLAPAALEQLLGVTAWSGFSARAHASSRSELTSRVCARKRAADLCATQRRAPDQRAQRARVWTETQWSTGVRKPVTLSMEGGDLAEGDVLATYPGASTETVDGDVGGIIEERLDGWLPRFGRAERLSEPRH